MGLLDPIYEQIGIGAGIYSYALPVSMTILENIWETVPDKFEFVFTPKRASWLNIIESFFSKMARSVLRGIRVYSINELKERISQYINQVHEKPVIFSWKYKIEERDEMPGGILI